MSFENDYLASVKRNGFSGAIAIATDAEVNAGAACGQMCLVHEVQDEENDNPGLEG